MRKKTTEEFIVDARAVHGDRYDYGKVNYTRSSDKVIIICKEHGEFPQTPNSHLIGCGCRKCVGKNKTTEEFIEDAKAVHGDRYDYSLVIYKRSDLKINIICKEHGIFPQSPNKHTLGRGCPKCVGKNKTTESFIQEAIVVHNGKYTYANTKYTPRIKKVIVTCPIHGDFPTSPVKHLSGIGGCPKCAGRYRTTEEFIGISNNIHNYKYSYTNTVYKNSSSIVVITCPIHGNFRQKVTNHYSGKGCSKCAKYGFDRSKPTVIYVYTFGMYAGFGITNDFKTRNSRHLCNFKKKELESVLVSKYNVSGELALDIERYLKQTLPIVDSGIEGFRTEAVTIENLQILLEAVNIKLKEVEINV